MRLGIGLAITVGIGLFASQRPAQADDRKDIDALYAKLAAALKANKLEDTLLLETPDFKAKGMDGKIRDGKQLIAQMKQEGANNKLKKFDIKLAKVAIKGKTASVDTTFSAESEMTAPAAKPGTKPTIHKMAMTGGIHNDLLKTAGGWKFKYMEDKPGGTMTMDGKLFDPSKMMAPPTKQTPQLGRPTTAK